jgi:tetratricopeptide (TPR) repeat protein
MNATSSTILHLLKTALPSAYLSWVAAALRQDATTWRFLQNNQNAALAAQAISNQPKDWNPAVLGLLPFCSKDLPVQKTIRLLQNDLQTDIDLQYRRKALQAYEEAPAQKETGLPDLEQSCLLALALRERLRLLGSWNSVLEELDQKKGRGEASSTSFNYWLTPLTCCWGIVPDPSALLNAVLAQEATSTWRYQMALHVLLSYPLPQEEQVEQVLQLANQLDPASRNELLHVLQQMRPQLASLVARHILDSRLPQEPDPPFQTPQFLIDLYKQKAEIFKLAGDPLQAAASFQKASQEALKLQTEFLNKAGQSALQAQKVDEAIHYYDQAASLSPDIEAKEMYQADLACALVEKGDLKEARQIIQTLQPKDSKLASTSRFSLQMAAANLAVKDGQLDEAARITENIFQELDQTLTAGFEAAELSRLATILFDLGQYLSAAKAAEMALAVQPHDAGLLFLHSSACSNVGEDQKALHSAQLAATLAPERIELRRLSAVLLEKSNLWQAALEERFAVLAVSPSEADQAADRLALANCALHVGQPETTLKICQELYETSEDEAVRAEALWYIGESLARQGQAQQAQEHFENATRLMPRFVQPWLASARLYRESGLAARALDTLRAAAQACSEEFEVHLALGEAYLGDWEGRGHPASTQALQALKQARRLALIEQTPREKHLQISLRLGQAMHQLGHLQEARQVLEPAFTLDQDYPELANAFAQVLVALSEHRPALTALEAVLRSNPIDPLPYIHYAKTLLALSEKPKEAANALRLALEISPNLAEAQAYLAEALEKAGNLEEALPAYQAALETNLVQDPGWRARLSYGLGRVALILSHVNLAVAALEEAASCAPQNSTISCRLSEAYEAAGCLDDAVRAGRNALRLGLDNLETLAWFSQQTLRWVESVKPNRKDTSAHGSVSWEVAAQLRIEALNALVHAVEMAPERANLRLQLGKLQRQTGDLDAATQTLKSLCQVEKAGIPDLFQAALELLDLDEANAAAACLERALHIHLKQGPQVSTQAPEYSVLVNTLARSYFTTGNFSAALEALEEGLSVSPKSIALYQQKANLLFEQGNLSEALKTLNQALDLAPEGEQAYTLRKMAVSILRSEGHLTQALEQAEKLIEHYKSPEQGMEELSSRILAAELARAMLLPEYAYTFLAADPPLDNSLANPHAPENSIGSRRSLLLEFLTLKAELALDLNQVENLKGAAESLSNAKELNSAGSKEEKENIRVRLRVLQARHQARSGNIESGLDILHTSIAGEHWPVSDKNEARHARKDQTGTPQPFDMLASTNQINNLLAVGFASIDYGHWDTALFVFRRAAELFPHEPLSFFHQARALILRAEAQQLCAELKADQNAPGSSALGEYAKESFEQAVQVPLDRITTWSSDLENPYQLAFLSVLPHLQRWQARGQAAFNPSLQKAQALVDLHTTGSAMDTAAAIAALRYAAHENLLPEAGQDGLESQSNPQIVASLTARAHPQNPLVLAQLALTLSQQEALLADALKAAHQALQLFRRKPAFLVNSPLPLPQDQAAIYQIVLAQLAYQSGELAIANEAAEGALAAWCKEARWHALAANIAIARNDFNTAVSHLEQAVILEPAYISHYLNLGQAYLSQGATDCQDENNNNTERALQILEQASRMAPERSEASLALARAFLQAGDLLRASQFAEVSLALASEQTQPLILSSEIALKKLDYQEAYERFQSALRLQENQQVFLQDPQYALLFVRILKGLGRFEQATSVLESALIHTKDPLPLLLEKVQILEYSEGPEKAVDALQSLNDRYPDHPQLLLPLTAALEKAGKGESAIDYAQKALKVSNQTDLVLEARDQGKLHFILGRLLRGAGQLDQAVHHLNEALRFLPNLVDVYLELGLTQQERRQHNQAIKVYEQAARVSPRDPRPYYHTGLLLREGKDYLAAESMLRRAAELAPEDLVIHRQLAAVIALNLVHNRRRRTIDA